MKREVDDDDDRPRRRRKKKKPWVLYLIVGGALGGVLILVLGVVIIIVVRARSGADKLPPPNAYVGYDSPEDVFHINLPKGWAIKQGGGRKNFYWASAERGGASIKVYESLVGSLISDIAGAGTPDLNVSDEQLPVSRVHEFKRQQFAEEYGNLQEEPAVSVKTRLGTGRRSTFTARMEFARKVRGYRTTALAPMTQLTVVCTCSPGDWENLEPAFARVIESLGPGMGGR